jgi:hypothetical protein
VLARRTTLLKKIRQHISTATVAAADLISYEPELEEQLVPVLESLIHIAYEPQEEIEQIKTTFANVLVKCRELELKGDLWKAVRDGQVACEGW